MAGFCAATSAEFSANRDPGRGRLVFCDDLLCRHAAHDDIELIANSDRGGKIDSEQAGEAAVGASLSGDRYIGNRAYDFALDRVGVRRRQRVRGVEPRRQLQDRRSADLRPIKARHTADRGLAPIDHYFVRVAQEAESVSRLGGWARTDIDRLGNAMGSGESRIAGGRHLEIALRQFVGVLRIFDDSAGVFDWRIEISNLRDEAVVGAAGQPILDGFVVRIPIGVG